MAVEFLGQESPRAFVREMEKDERGFTLELWQKLAEVGWLGLIIPEEYGGAGQTFLDLGLLMEQVGRYSVDVSTIDLILLPRADGG